MRLVRVRVHGYKRFAAPAEMNVDGRVIAIVGPNEAGKTSFLEALAHLTETREFGNAEWSRGHERPDGEIVSARFLIEDSDRDAMGALPGVEAARWYVLWKGPDGKLYHRIEPKGVIRRDRRQRRNAVDVLRKAAAHRLLRDPDTDDQPSPLAETLRALADALDTDVESFEDAEIGQIREAGAAFAGTTLGGKAPKYLLELPDLLTTLADHESGEAPRDIGLAVLDRRQPRFLVFGDAERDLRSDYDLTEVANDPPAALSNLAELADLNLQSLRDAAVAQDYPRVEHLIEQANVRLRELFGQAWQQSGVYLRLGTDETVLRIFVSATGGGYTDVAERSDGLRAFIALITFAALRAGGRRPVLLVDEAENHLHYDAQADLIRVFSRQQQAAKVIYTTHSAGCLPQDLAGVRMIVAEGDGTSTVRNAFWSEGPGLTPLFIGMGASVLAFSAARRAVFAEGGSDLVLLPTLLREACRLGELDFQVVPGLSEVHPDRVPGLDLEAAAVGYLVDGDRAGTAIRRKLIGSGVPQNRVVTLGGVGSGVVLEDTVRREIYIQAINEEIERSHSSAPRLQNDDVGDRNRPDDLRQWCRRNGVPEPNKTAVAYRILDTRSRGDRIVATNRRETLKRTYNQLAALLAVKQV